ncbi:hypothetical protein [Alkalitalea saponilacus]|uniref:Uncharacterized protein n=1 Tax=Alkalitalea saponilacus TaxID=889453 RepID=A0A1T5HQA7_9BACT|nr:hypothetical protein [Alkalitalea saponilacus]ASB48446.1 hypothetical protein CDL62_04470 [Alkalitalea saponilacus]SKC22884.1 hypothetical protein SAMN03080601_02607 [Alkalitalea saponilacus]
MSEFNIDTTLREMADAIGDTISKDKEKIKEIIVKILNRRRERMKMLVELRITGDLTQQRFESRLEDEKKVLEAEFNAIAALNKAMVQKAVNAALDVLTKTVRALL